MVRDLECRKHCGQAGMTEPRHRSSAPQGIVRGEKGQEQATDTVRVQDV